MTAPFVAGLRTRPSTIRIGRTDGPAVTLRVQGGGKWDAVRIETPLSEPAVSLKAAALAALFPEAEYHDDYVLKLRGFEVLDERASLDEIGAVNGSIFLLAHRRRQPVR
ncbi:MAG TPA: hypothetical protein VFZ11_10395 [Gemmatimonadaceae bacterium]